MPDKWYLRIGTLGFNLLLLNLLWISFSLLGLIILGLFPATVALFSVLRQAIIFDDDTSIFKLFVNKFKTEFINSNVIGYIALALGIILYIDLKVLQQLDNGIIQTTLASVTVVISCVYIVTALYIIPVFVHFNLTPWQYPKYALILSIGRPFQTIMMICGIIVVLFLYMKFPPLTLLFGMSFIGYIMMTIASKSLPQETSTL